MSDANNPFQSPEADIKIEKPLVYQGTLTNAMAKYLSDASPWLRFIGIIGFIGSGLAALAGLICIAVMPFAISIFDEARTFFSDFIGPFSMMVIYGSYLIGAGVLMFFPALFTYRFGAKIRSYIQTNAEIELELAFKNNWSLWKFQGILTIIGLAIIPVAIVIAVIVAVAAFAIG